MAGAWDARVDEINRKKRIQEAEIRRRSAEEMRQGMVNSGIPDQEYTTFYQNKSAGIPTKNPYEGEWGRLGKAAGKFAFQAGVVEPVKSFARTLSGDNARRYLLPGGDSGWQAKLGAVGEDLLNVASVVPFVGAGVNAIKAGTTRMAAQSAMRSSGIRRSLAEIRANQRGAALFGEMQDIRNVPEIRATKMQEAIEAALRDLPPVPENNVRVFHGGSSSLPYPLTSVKELAASQAKRRNMGSDMLLGPGLYATDDASVASTYMIDMANATKNKGAMNYADLPVQPGYPTKIAGMPAFSFDRPDPQQVMQITDSLADFLRSRQDEAVRYMSDRSDEMLKRAFRGNVDPNSEAAIQVQKNLENVKILFSNMAREIEQELPEALLNENFTAADRMTALKKNIDRVRNVISKNSPYNMEYVNNTMWEEAINPYASVFPHPGGVWTNSKRHNAYNFNSPENLPPFAELDYVHPVDFIQSQMDLLPEQLANDMARIDSIAPQLRQQAIRQALQARRQAAFGGGMAMYPRPGYTERR